MSAQDVLQVLHTADRPGALQRYARLTPFEQTQVAREISRWERIRNGDRAQPDANPIFHNNASPTAVAPPTGLPRQLFNDTPERHHDDYTPEMIAHGDRSFDNIQRETATFTLQRQVGTDAERPPEPPTMRDQLEAAAELFGGTK